VLWQVSLEEHMLAIAGLLQCVETPVRQVTAHPTLTVSFNMTFAANIRSAGNNSSAEQDTQRQTATAACPESIGLSKPWAADTGRHTAAPSKIHVEHLSVSGWQEGE
jgi:hypothetical protein